MDRSSWMYGIKRDTIEYLRGIDEFVKCAMEDMRLRGVRTLLCPCRDCQNLRRLRNIDEVRDHLICRGFKERYTQWKWHGESDNVGTGTSVRDVPNFGEFIENENIENLDGASFVQDDQLAGDENAENVDIPHCNDEQNDDNLDEMMNDVAENFNDIPEIFENYCNESNVPLFPGCTKFTKMSAVFKLYNLKAKNGWSDKSFTSLLGLLGEMLPEKNELPDSTYRAKKLLCPLSMSVEKINACPNDCILYRGVYGDFDKCPKCNASRYNKKDDESDDRKRPAAKVFWYLPIIPRFQRLFANPKDAKLLRWHYECRKDDGMLRHPADSPEWRNIDRLFNEFGGEPRNMRLGLCTDGMNPYGNMSSRHSTWPVLLCVYNLPPWLCMKRRYLMMPLLISGPKQPGNDIDVFLAPLFEELDKLWRDGVRVFDASKKEFFTLRAMILCTINDFPAYSNLSGFRNKGAKACPICAEETCSLRLPKCKKNVYMGHRRFLRRNHPYRRKKEEFDGTVELRNAPMALTGKEVYDQVKNLNVQFGKKSEKIPDGLWKKRSIFWNLPYWPNLQVRHCLDGMHIIKNICESLVGTLLNIQGKTKDGVKARQDMVIMGIRPGLAPQDGGKRIFLPPASFTLSKREKISLLECLKSIKVPSGYSSNISRNVSIKELKLIGMKSHDCHVLLTQLLPVAIRGILPQNVRHSITKLCFFFNSICSKVIDPGTLDQLQADVVLTLCELEMHLPPSFFDIMVHLTVHLVREIKMCGPMFLRYMYPFERAMGQLKGLVRSRSRPEGSIVQGYVAEEVIEFCTDYLAGVEPIGLPKSRHDGRLHGTGTIGFKLVKVGLELRNKAHLKVLQHLAVVSPYVDEHLAELRQRNPCKDENWITSEHSINFVKWFTYRVQSQRSENLDESVKWLSNGPGATVSTYQGYDMNGFIWYTKQQDKKSTVQNSGVTLVALSGAEDTSMSYYGWIEEIWELDYFKFRIPVFLCKWIDNRRGVRKDKDGFVTVDFKRLGYLDDPFILAKQAKQIFYVVDPADKKLHVVLSGKRRIVGIGDVVDEEEYDHFDEIPPFSDGIEPLQDERNTETPHYLRSDHDEGVWVEPLNTKKPK